MKRKQMIKKIWQFLLVVMMMADAIIISPKVAKASSAAVNLSLSVEEVTVDQNFSVVLNVEASEEIGSFSCFLFYDDEMLEFVSGGKYITAGKGTVLVSDKNTSDGKSNRIYSMKFKPIKSGETTICLEDEIKVKCAQDDTLMSVSTNELLFYVEEPVRLSKDASLKSLTVSTAELTPAFSKKVKRYTMTIPSLIDRIMVNAEPNDPDAVVKITGNTGLKEGKNVVKVSVTAPSGKKSVTKIIVYRGNAPVDETSEVNGEEESSPDETITDPSLKLQENKIGPVGVVVSEDELGNRFLTEQLRVQVLNLEDEALIPEGYMKTSIVLNGLPIMVLTPKDNLEEDEVLVYGMNQEGETGLYIYSRANNSLQEYKGTIVQTNSGDAVLTVEEESAKNSPMVSMLIIILILAAALIVVSVAFILNLTRKDGKSRKSDREDDFFI